MSEDLQAQYRQLQRELMQIGWITRGSAYPRHYTIHVNGKPKCCGPYYSLTWKKDNKTQTKALSTEQYKLFSKAIANQRKLDRFLAKMRRISTRFIHQSTHGVAKRNRVKLTKKYPYLSAIRVNPSIIISAIQTVGKGFGFRPRLLQECFDRARWIKTAEDLAGLQVTTPAWRRLS